MSYRQLPSNTLPSSSRSAQQWSATIAAEAASDLGSVEGQRLGASQEHCIAYGQRDMPLVDMGAQVMTPGDLVIVSQLMTIAAKAAAPAQTPGCRPWTGGSPGEG